MTSGSLLRGVVTALEELQIPYMLTGSLAGAAHGVPRATLDIDLVIDPDEQQLRDLVQRFPPPRFHADAHSALDALVHRSQFNVVDIDTGTKVDLIIRKDRPFNRAEFARRTRLDLSDYTLDVVTIEDLVLAKLEWARLSESARQLEDVAALLRAGWEVLDRSHVERWAGELGVELEWGEALRRAFPGGAPGRG